MCAGTGVGGERVGEKKRRWGNIKGKMDSNLFVGPYCVVSSCCGRDHLVCYDSCMNCVNMLLSVHKQTFPHPCII